MRRKQWKQKSRSLNGQGIRSKPSTTFGKQLVPTSPWKVHLTNSQRSVRLCQSCDKRYGKLLKRLLTVPSLYLRISSSCFCLKEFQSVSASKWYGIKSG